ncbi:MAG: cysteine dioxygenase family protein [Cyanobacteriota bacterium]|nr:cysteine dioxygenase family protein [Cyanobacteriota bacterium]
MVPTASEPTNTHPIETCPASLQRLIQALRQADRLTPEQVKKTLLNSCISPRDLMPWADFDHPIADSYGRKLVFDGGNFEIMVMSWLPGDFSAIHDHGATQWGAVQCFGSAEHYIYRFAEGVLSTLEPAHYSPGTVCAVDRSLIHQMGNSSNMPFLSLHVYGCEEVRGTITGNARIFDLLENSIQYTDGGVFFCLPETQINKRLPGINADRETALRHHYQMSDRLDRILQTQRLKTQENEELTQKLAILRAQIRELSRES